MSKIAQVETKNDPELNTALAERSADRPLKMARAAATDAAEAMNARLQRARNAAESALEDQAGSARKSTAEATETGRMVLDLVAEQARHGIDTASALGRATNWSEIIQAQSDFISGSFARINQINQRYLDLFRNGMNLMRSPTRS